MIERQYSFPLSFHGTIFDLETTGLDVERDALVTIGYFSQGHLRIYQRDSPTKSASEQLRDLSKTLAILPRPYFSYNKEFEESWLGYGLDLDMMTKWKMLSQRIKVPNHMWCRYDRWVKPTKEGLCPQCGGWLHDTIKWPSSAELISLPHAYFFRSDIDGSEVPKIWDRYVKTRNKELLELIIFHNFNDLIRDYCLYVWDETVASLIGEKLKESAQVPRSIYELLMAGSK